jgi:hypothetical protein
MPFALLIIGAVLLISAARGTTNTGPNGAPGLFALLESDFTGSDNFIFWLVAILIIGAVGYIPKLRPISVAFLTLVIIVLFLTKGNPSGVGGGFFAQFTSAIGGTQSVNPSTYASSTASAGGSSLTSLLSGIEGSNPVLSAPGSDLSSLGLGSASSASGSNITSLIGGIEGSNPVESSPVQSPLNSLSPVASSTDLSFPSLGIGA